MKRCGLFNAPATVFGCTDPMACNYNEAASIDDGTCASCEALATACGEERFGIQPHKPV